MPKPKKDDFMEVSSPTEFDRAIYIEAEPLT